MDTRQEMARRLRAHLSAERRKVEHMQRLLDILERKPEPKGMLQRWAVAWHGWKRSKVERRKSNEGGRR